MILTSKGIPALANKPRYIRLAELTKLIENDRNLNIRMWLIMLFGFAIFLVGSELIIKLSLNDKQLIYSGCALFMASTAVIYFGYIYAINAVKNKSFSLESIINKAPSNSTLTLAVSISPVIKYLIGIVFILIGVLSGPIKPFVFIWLGVGVMLLPTIEKNV